MGSTQQTRGGCCESTATTNDVKVIGGLGEMKSNGGRQWYYQDRIYSSEGISPALNNESGRLNIQVRSANKDGNETVKIGGVVSIAFPESDTRRGRVIDGGDVSPTLDTGCQVGRIEEDDDGIRIRKLTPRECFRLQGFPDEYFERAASVCSDSQLYKQAGNAVSVPVVYEIAKRLEVKE